MTDLGTFLSKKSVSKAEISRKTGISKSRLSELSTNIKTQLKAKELYLIAMAIDVNPNEIMKDIFHGVKLLKN